MKLSKDDLLLYAITDRGNLDKKEFFTDNIWFLNR